MQQAQRIADDTMFMYMGEVIETGTTTRIFNRPEKELSPSYVHGNFG
jgi:phosphate transport system ATP-binding protein